MGTGRWALILSGGIFGLFVANIVVGRILVNIGRVGATGVPNVVEFLLLFLAVVFFVACILIREHHADRAGATERGLK